MGYTIAKIAYLLYADTPNGLHDVPEISHLLIDSRRCLFPQSSLFFAFPGAATHGMDYVAELYAKGVRSFVLPRLPKNSASLPEANFLVVESPLEALQALARYHRHQFDIPVIGITGSNGKTIVKEWLNALLQPDLALTRSPGSFNSQIGVPLSVWTLQPEHQLALFEAGISRHGEMAKLEEVIRPTIGLLTNIGEAHSEGFSSRSEKLREKLMLFHRTKTLICSIDDPFVAEELDRTEIKPFTWSRLHGANIRLMEARKLEKTSLLKISFRGEEFEVSIPFTDPASLENAMHCLATMLYLDYDPKIIASRMARLQPIALRLEVKEGIRGCTLIDDSYSADLKGFEQALHILAQQDPGRQRTLILSDFPESGLADQVLYALIAQMLRQKGIVRFIGVGGHIPAIRAALPESIEATFFPDTEGLLRVFDRLSFHDEVILLKGARRFAFERIAHRLERKRSRSTLEIHLDALAYNLRCFQRGLKSKTRLMAMVKASAYGGGSLEIARKLAYQGVDYLAVAYVDEGVDLREGGIKLPILVLTPDPTSFDTLHQYDLEPELYSLDILGSFSDFCESRHWAAPVHINIDTGMHRLGFFEGELEKVADIIQANPLLRVASIFSHLAASEDPRHDAFTHEQASKFEARSEVLASLLGYTPLRHLLNSAGIARFPEYHFDMVRLGLGLYGVAPMDGPNMDLRPVFHFHAAISQIRDVAAGETIGYGRHGKADKSLRIGTISAGYADGLPMGAGMGRFAPRVQGKPAPLVGKVCMDMSMIDLSDTPEAQPGDRVDIFGYAPKVQELALAAGTIPYAIFTGISPRVKRIYIEEGQ